MIDGIFFTELSFTAKYILNVSSVQHCTTQQMLCPNVDEI